MAGASSHLTTIKLRRDFLAAGKGTRQVTGTLILLSMKRAGDHPVKEVPRIGYTVTKKMGNAVVRNRIKRRLREAVRQVAPALASQGYDYVVISRPKAVDCEFSEMLRDMQFAFSRITAK